MSLFTDTTEQSRQRERIKRTGATGARKNLMALAGYDKYGEANILGKAMSFVPVGGLIGREVAKRAAKGTDAEDLLKATDDEFRTKQMAAFNFAKDAALLGVSGGLGSSVATGAKVPELATPGISKGTSALNMAGGTDAVGAMGEVAGIQDDKTGYEFLDAPFETGDQMKMGGTPEDAAVAKSEVITDLKNKSEEDAVVERMDERMKEDKKEVVSNNKQMKALAESLPSVLGSGLELYRSSKAFSDAEDLESRKILSRKKELDLSNIYR